MLRWLVVGLLLCIPACIPFITPRQSEYEIINQKVNAFPYKTDLELYNKQDYWATPEEFFRNGAGDCEDFVIAKHFLLKDKTDAKMLIVRLRTTNEIHAVLDVKGYILDNRTNAILKRDSMDFFMQYEFLLTVII